LAGLENIGLYDALRTTSREAQSQNNAQLLQELKTLQTAAKKIIQGSSFEVEIHKDRVKVLEKQLMEVHRRNSHYIEQQAMFDLIRNDLEKYKQVFEISKSLETMYSPFTPVN
jgi:phosphoenolpyruvate synthase/pyruvate phosphate dikinase